MGMAGNTLFSLILNAVHLTEHFSNASQEALFQSNLLLQIIGIGLLSPLWKNWSSGDWCTEK
ncbi:MAG: hypothetical protein ACLR2E_08440 [Lachnospiraceae bacterium]